MSEQFKSASDAIEWINGLRWKGEKHGLENTRALLGELGNPQTRMGKILHVAGTNGKGSTCAFLDSALRSCGYKTGLFTSPYLRRFNERIQLNGQPIDDDELVTVASTVREASQKLTERGIYCTTFELLTACACVYFAQKACDFCVIEVGMGGRLDSTNVLNPTVCAIAAIGMDHMASLGDTLEKIACEKAGIMKQGISVAAIRSVPEVNKVFEAQAQKAGAPLYMVDYPKIISESYGGSSFKCKLPDGNEIIQHINMSGAYQTQNAALALNVLNLAGVDMELASKGVESTHWEGRLELRGNVLIDCAHNPQGANALKEYVERFFADRKKLLISGMMRDKQTAECARIFKSFADRVITTKVDWPRAIEPNEYAALFGGNAICCDNPKAALNKARELTNENWLIICAGSVYLAGDILNIIEEETN